jgi:hypothetical protein
MQQRCLLIEDGNHWFWLIPEWETNSLKNFWVLFALGNTP